MARIKLLLAILTALTMLTVAAQEAAPVQEGPPPVLMMEGNPAAGASIAEAVCFECHSADGSSVDPTVPRIAGQLEDYLKLQLFLLNTGARPGPTMNEIAAALSEQQIADLAAFFAGQEPRAQSWPGQDPALIERGATVFHAGVVADGVIACAICHGPTGAGIAEAEAPRIFGQSPAYLRDILAEFAMVPDFGVAAANAMHVVASNLSPTDLDAVIAYVASQPWEDTPTTQNR